MSILFRSSKISAPAHRGGFTLIEVLVSVAMFAVVMVIALGALLSMSEADRKAQTLKSIINNLNFSMESMSRSIRTSTDWQCGAGAGVPCPSGATVFRVGSPLDVIYRWETANATLCAQPSGTVGCLTRSTDGGVTYFPITSPEVIITNLTFYVVGNATDDQVQPKVTILVSGYIRAGSSNQTFFDLETSVTQRLYDQ